jgi:hypothetical protein
MLESPAFAWTCLELERETSLSPLVARGTVRLALRQAGLQPQSVSGEQMAIVLREILPQELATGPSRCQRCAPLAAGSDAAFEGSDAVTDVFTAWRRQVASSAGWGLRLRARRASSDLEQLFFREAIRREHAVGDRGSLRVPVVAGAARDVREALARVRGREAQAPHPDPGAILGRERAEAAREDVPGRVRGPRRGPARD